MYFSHTGFCQLELLCQVAVVHETGTCFCVCQAPGLGADCTMGAFLNEQPVQPRGPMYPPDPLWHPVHLPDPDRKPGHPAIWRLHRFKVFCFISVSEVHVATKMNKETNSISFILQQLSFQIKHQDITAVMIMLN